MDKVGLVSKRGVPPPHDSSRGAAAEAAALRAQVRQLQSELAALQRS